MFSQLSALTSYASMYLQTDSLQFIAVEIVVSVNLCVCVCVTLSSFVYRIIQNRILLFGIGLIVLVTIIVAIYFMVQHS